MPLTARSDINLLRAVIYAAAGADHWRGSTRSRRLRQACHYACGLDLRRRSDVVCLAQHLRLLPEPAMPVLDELELAPMPEAVLELAVAGSPMRICYEAPNCRPTPLAKPAGYASRQAQITNWGIYACEGFGLELSGALVNEAQSEYMATRLAGCWRA